MSSLNDAELNALVGEAVVDCYDEHEQLSGLFPMIEDDLALSFDTQVSVCRWWSARWIYVRRGSWRSVTVAGCGGRSAFWTCRCPIQRRTVRSWSRRTGAGRERGERIPYYEFVALDRALTAKQQGELRAVSSRGRISSSSFVNDYQWGDLKADPAEWMERYFGAHLYLANWDSRRIMLRLSRASLAPETAARFCVGESGGARATRTHMVIDLRSADEDGDKEWWDEDGRLAAIVPARADLAGGDRRLPYLAWLLSVQNRELDDDEPEPPVPAGLAKLSGLMQALADFLRLDPTCWAWRQQRANR